MDDDSAGAGEIVLVGTAHVSEDSVERVRERIDEEHPDVVAVELDENRYRSLKGEVRDDLDPKDLIQGTRPIEFLIYWLLSFMQNKLGDEFGIEPGADMLAAIEEAEERDIPVALVDRDIQVTVQRLWNRMGFVEKLRLVGGLVVGVGPPVTVGLSIGAVVGLLAATAAEILGGPYLLPTSWTAGESVDVLTRLAGMGVTALDGLLVTGLVAVALGLPLALVIRALRPDEEIEEFDVEELTDTDVVTALIEEFRAISPRGAEALIDERDAYIASKLVALRDRGERVVAVVGAGHEAGIRRYLEDPASLPDIDALEEEASGRRFSLFKLIGYLISAFVVGMFLLLVIAGASNALLAELFVYWFLINGVLAFGAAKLAGAHTASAAVGGLVAWMTSINPALAPGWFAGYVELRYEDVSVGDIDDINEILADTTASTRELLGRMRAIPMFRLIMVVAATNVGSIVGTWLFVAVVLPVVAEGADVEMTALLSRGLANAWDAVVGGLPMLLGA